MLKTACKYLASLCNCEAAAYIPVDTLFGHLSCAGLNPVPQYANAAFSRSGYNQLVRLDRRNYAKSQTE
jgi:hypothetical protein